MHADLEKLVRLQRAETEMQRLEGDLADVPRRKAELEAALVEERKRLEAVKESLANCQKARRAHEGALQDLEGKRSKYKGQLMDVKTNKEYTAMLHEIEAVERDIRSREDQVLAEMETSEALTAEMKREEELFRKAEERHRVEGGALDARARALQAEAARGAAERDGVAATVPGDMLELFHRVAKLRGVAVAEARDGMCQLCHLKLRLQMYVELKRNDQIMQCPACNRILYYEPPPPVVSPEP